MLRYQAHELNGTRTRGHPLADLLNLYSHTNKPTNLGKMADFLEQKI